VGCYLTLKIKDLKIKYMNTNTITGYVPTRAISTVKGKFDIAVGTSGVANTANAMNRE
jgi:hypothetical protein